MEMLSGFVILQVQVCKADSKRQKDENKIQDELGYIYISIIIRMKAGSSGPVIELALKNDRFLTKAKRIATARMQYEARMTLYPRFSAWLSHVIAGGCSLRIDRPTHQMTWWRTSNVTKARATKFQ